MSTSHRMQSDILLIPAYLTGVSILVFAGRSIYSALSKCAPITQSGPKTRILQAGKVIVAWRLLRLVGCLVLCGLSVASTLLQSRSPRDIYVQISICAAFVSYLYRNISLLSSQHAGLRRPPCRTINIWALKGKKFDLYSSLPPPARYHGGI